MKFKEHLVQGHKRSYIVQKPYLELILYSGQNNQQQSYQNQYYQQQPQQNYQQQQQQQYYQNQNQQQFYQQQPQQYSGEIPTYYNQPQVLYTQIDESNQQPNTISYQNVNEYQK